MPVLVRKHTFFFGSKMIDKHTHLMKLNNCPLQKILWSSALKNIMFLALFSLSTVNFI